MTITENIRSLARQVIMIISVHTALLVICSYAHEKIDSLYAITASMPVLLFFCIAPLVISLFLLTKFARPGSILLLGILPVELIYNIVMRFAALPPIAQQEPGMIWKILYEGTFGLILLFDVIVIWLTFKLLQDIHKQMESPKETVSQ
jgi:hypothetical protein